MRTILSLLLAIVIAFAAGCSPDSESTEQAVNQLSEEGEFEEALDLARTKADETGDETLLIETHLAYANYLTHEADHLAMGERMGDALAHYRRVLELDETNSQAQSHIELIEGIYDQMGRDVPQGVAE
ncbi:hypothetical protein [Natronogracilivirga saccharolytica]|uniref:Tetratricopeptide repeat protein n=1 Tax=Natronogracilivirga saccharolytica TaxID=2812953 RepID=A0A8J7S9F8_9BACT|nr:hypothetical protein [Natronogracilivirga saccharolytica]MBP3192848.1 hypothetical protein [Natronogracilivirga saccharolytica]